MSYLSAAQVNHLTRNLVPRMGNGQPPLGPGDADYRIVVDANMALMRNPALSALSREVDGTPEHKMLSYKTASEAQAEWKAINKNRPVPHITAFSDDPSAWGPNQCSPTRVTPGNPAMALCVPGVEWQDQLFFKGLTEEVRPYWGKATYDLPAKLGFNGWQDATGFIFGQAEITPWNLPCIFYMIHSPPERAAYARKKIARLPVRDANGDIVYEKWPRQDRNVRDSPRPLRHFPGVPLTISSDVEWFRVEMWRRLYPDLTMADIQMRMQPDLNGPRTWSDDRRIRNAMNMRCSRRTYPAYKMISWFGKGLDIKSAAAREQFFRELHAQSRAGASYEATNCTRGWAPGLVDPYGLDTPMNRVRQPTVSIRDMVRVRGGRCKAPIPKPVTGRRRREVDEEVDEAPVVKRPRGRPARASKQQPRRSGPLPSLVPSGVSTSERSSSSEFVGEQSLSATLMPIHGEAYEANIYNDDMAIFEPSSDFQPSLQAGNLLPSAVTAPPRLYNNPDFFNDPSILSPALAGRSLAASTLPRGLAPLATEPPSRVLLHDVLLGWDQEERYEALDVLGRLGITARGMGLAGNGNYQINFNPGTDWSTWTIAGDTSSFPSSSSAGAPSSFGGF